ncbi:mucin-3A-like [Pecten maximus]|uniref:mucin-3A-like n=1 Tax=Pecten maximus TaxID=6579 RepID=UPI00145844B4|nr:mucin-3A-like [Pecten maximus]
MTGFVWWMEEGIPTTTAPATTTTVPPVTTRICAENSSMTDTDVLNILKDIPTEITIEYIDGTEEDVLLTNLKDIPKLSELVKPGNTQKITVNVTLPQPIEDVSGLLEEEPAALFVVFSEPNSYTQTEVTVDIVVIDENNDVTIKPLEEIERLTDNDQTYERSWSLDKLDKTLGFIFTFKPVQVPGTTTTPSEPSETIGEFLVDICTRIPTTTAPATTTTVPPVTTRICAENSSMTDTDVLNILKDIPTEITIEYIDGTEEDVLLTNLKDIPKLSELVKPGNTQTITVNVTLPQPIEDVSGLLEEEPAALFVVFSEPNSYTQTEVTVDIVVIDENNDVTIKPLEEIERLTDNDQTYERSWSLDKLDKTLGFIFTFKPVQVPGTTTTPSEPSETIGEFLVDICTRIPTTTAPATTTTVPPVTTRICAENSSMTDTDVLNILKDIPTEITIEYIDGTEEDVLLTNLKDIPKLSELVKPGNTQTITVNVTLPQPIEDVSGLLEEEPAALFVVFSEPNSYTQTEVTVDIVVIDENNDVTIKPLEEIERLTDNDQTYERSWSLDKLDKTLGFIFTFKPVQVPGTTTTPSEPSETIGEFLVDICTRIPTTTAPATTTTVPPVTTRICAENSSMTDTDVLNILKDIPTEITIEYIDGTEEDVLLTNLKDIPKLSELVKPGNTQTITVNVTLPQPIEDVSGLLEEEPAALFVVFSEPNSYTQTEVTVDIVVIDENNDVTIKPLEEIERLTDNDQTYERSWSLDKLDKTLGFIFTFKPVQVPGTTTTPSEPSETIGEFLVDICTRIPTTTAPATTTTVPPVTTRICAENSSMTDTDALNILKDIPTEITIEYIDGTEEDVLLTNLKDIPKLSELVKPGNTQKITVNVTLPQPIEDVSGLLEEEPAALFVVFSEPNSYTQTEVTVDIVVIDENNDVTIKPLEEIERLTDNDQTYERSWSLDKLDKTLGFIFTFKPVQVPGTTTTPSEPSETIGEFLVDICTRIPTTTAPATTTTVPPVTTRICAENSSMTDTDVLNILKDIPTEITIEYIDGTEEDVLLTNLKDIPKLSELVKPGNTQKITVNVTLPQPIEDVSGLLEEEPAALFVVFSEPNSYTQTEVTVDIVVIDENNDVTIKPLEEIERLTDNDQTYERSWSLDKLDKTLGFIFTFKPVQVPGTTTTPSEPSETIGKFLVDICASKHDLYAKREKESIDSIDRDNSYCE